MVFSSLEQLVVVWVSRLEEDLQEIKKHLWNETSNKRDYSEYGFGEDLQEIKKTLTVVRNGRLPQIRACERKKLLL